jgi:DNA-directed RNA polymerase specialized sigma24 family protein
VRVLKAAPGFQLDRRRGRFGAWLWTVVHHAVADHFREQRRVHGRETPWQDHLQQAESLGQTPPDATWLEAQRLHVFRCAMERVCGQSQPATWACFEQHLVKGHPAGEVGRELGLSAGAVYTNASRVLSRVRQQCADYLEDLADE